MSAVIILRDHQLRSKGDQSIRRQVLKNLAGLAGFSILAGILGRKANNIDSALIKEQSAPEEPMAPYQPEIKSRLKEARELSLDIDGLPPMVTESDEFYEVDINQINPEVNAQDWALTVKGAVENEFSLSYDELLTLDVDHRFVTLRCVSDPLNGRKNDNALWTGVPLKSILERAKSQTGCECVMLRAADDYYVEVPLEKLKDGLLAYGMNGEVLPQDHGYPVRVLIPGVWGHPNIKWLTQIKVLDRTKDGYWEKRGWKGTSSVNTNAKIWTVNRHNDGRLQVGGIAYAGTRGISKVELRPRLNSDWKEASLSEPLPDRGTWRQWSYEWTPPEKEGEYIVIARAIDGEGNKQRHEQSKSFPDGATGYTQRKITVGTPGGPWIS